MRTSFVLTVAQSKRLIAKGVAQLPEVKHALAEGILAIGRGTTNAYVVEGYVAGIMPQNFSETMSEDEINGLVTWLLSR